MSRQIRRPKCAARAVHSDETMKPTSLVAAYLATTLLGCSGWVSDDVHHEREAAIVTPALTFTSPTLALDYHGIEQVWNADPTAACEITAQEDSIDDEGRLSFVMAGNEAAPIALGFEIILRDTDAPEVLVGLHAHGASEWKPAEDCRVEILDTDYGGRAFALSIDCRFTSEGEEDVVVAGSVLTERCFDPSAASLESLRDLVVEGGILAGSLALDLGEAFVDDPVGFGRTILLLPLLAAGGH